MPAAFTGFGELAFITTDGSGPNGQEGAYFPYPTGFTLEKATEVVDKFAFKPCGGTGRKQKVARFTGQEDWTGSMTFGVQSWLDLQFLYGQKAQTTTVSYKDVKCATVASNVITDAALNGLTPADVQVTWADYDATGGSPVQLEVAASPGTATATKVILDNAANTLTFAAQFEGLEIFYVINASGSKSAVGLSNATLLTGFEFYGVINTNAGSSAAGYGLYIPKLVLDGNFSINLTGGDDEIEVPFSPVLSSGYSEPVILIEL